MSRQLRKLRRDGFCVVRGLLSPARVTAVNESIHRTIRDQLKYLGAPSPAPDLHAALRTLHATDLGRYRQTVAALWRKAEVSGLMHHPRLFEFMREALGWEDVFLPGGDVVFIMAADLEIPGGYFGLDAHQDFPSVQGSLDALVAWIPLSDVDRRGYPIELVAGSHRRGLITEVDETATGWNIRAEQLLQAKWQPIVVSAGDVVFMSVFTIHRSVLIADPGRLRIALSTRFDNAAEPTFIARAYPTAYKRQVHRDQYVPDFPTAEQIRQLFD